MRAKVECTREVPWAQEIRLGEAGAVEMSSLYMGQFFFMRRSDLEQ